MRAPEDLLVPKEGTLKCRRCKQWLAPMYGSLKQEQASHALSPRGIRLALERIADASANSYFECYECAAKRRVRKIIFWLILGSLAGIALLYGEVRAGRLKLPW